MKRYIAMILSILLVSFPFPGRAYAADHGLGFGGIEVSLDVYAEDGQGDRTDPYPILFPGQPASYVIQVNNHYDASWVRVRIDGLLNEEEPIEVIPLSDSRWIRRGDYYYYTEPLGCEESVVMCRAIEIPPDAGYQGTVSLGISAGAIQAENFQPDFDREDPFRGVKTEATAHIDEGQWQHNMEQVQGPVHISYDDAASSLVDDTGLFGDGDGPNALLPGTRLQDSFLVRNDSGNIKELSLFSMETGEHIPEAKRVLLQIERDGRLLYQDSLLNEDLKQGILLAVLPPGTESRVTFTIRVPEDMTNAMAVQNIAVEWAFQATERQMPPPDNSGATGQDAPEAVPGYLYRAPDLSLKTGIHDGDWILADEEKHWWKYRFRAGSLAKGGWVFLHNPYHKNLAEYSWYHFDENGTLSFGWVRSDNDNWYFTHGQPDGDLGTLVTGWHQDMEDGNRYYLDPVSGIMQTGWKYIDGEYYYFATLKDTYKQNWFWNTHIGRWLYDRLGDRTYGSMYRQEKTPDGYEVDDTGALQEDT